MLFSVIYSFDILPRTDWTGNWTPSVKNFQPPRIRQWQCTEGDEQYEYGYLHEGRKGGKHRKYCALLTKAQFREFVDECYLCAEKVETMGSLGAPGFDMGWAPAISFTRPDRPDSMDAVVSAYVTPIPEPVGRSEDKPFTEREWNRVRNIIISMFS